MGQVYNFFSWVAKQIPVLLGKLGSVFLFFFGCGMILGYYFALYGFSWLVLVIPFVSIAIMWHDLDQGFLVFILLMTAAFFFPNLFIF